VLLSDQLKSTIRDVHGYPKPGIVFKDITPVLADPKLMKQTIRFMVDRYRDTKPDVVAGIEARGFILGSILAHELGCRFVPIRKAGKLPFTTRKEGYDLEYGSAVIEVHTDAVRPGDQVLIHDDLLATGGTACAAGRLVKSLGGEISAFSFLINLSFLPGAGMIQDQFGISPDFLIKY
jgi:adenine phosphoribosyltransferase